MSRRIVCADRAARPPAATYSQVVEAAGLVFVSGTAPHDPATGASAKLPARVPGLKVSIAVIAEG